MARGGAGAVRAGAPAGPAAAPAPAAAGALRRVDRGRRAAGAVPASPREARQTLPYSYGGSGEMFFSKETLDQIMAGMRLKKSGNTRLVEGGRYNINLRWNGTPSVELHEQTIDTWYVLAGGATVNTGYQVKDGQRVPSSGVSVATKPGDVFFHPSNFYHGFSSGDARHLLAEHPLGRQLRVGRGAGEVSRLVQSTGTPARAGGPEQCEPELSRLARPANRHSHRLLSDCTPYPSRMAGQRPV